MILTGAYMSDYIYQNPQSVQTQSENFTVHYGFQVIMTVIIILNQYWLINCNKFPTLKQDVISRRKLGVGKGHIRPFGTFHSIFYLPFFP